MFADGFPCLVWFFLPLPLVMPPVGVVPYAHFRQVTEFAVFAVCLDGQIVGHAFRESIDDPLSDQARVNLVGMTPGVVP